MKRILALVLACVIAVNMGAVAWASSIGDYKYAPGEETEDTLTGLDDLTFGMAITADASGAAPAYYVTVTWDSMAFTYTGDGTGDWNPEDHAYEGGGGSWTGGGADGEQDTSYITITNDSSVDVYVSCTYEAQNPGEYESGEPYNGVTVTLTTDSDYITLEAGTTENVDDPDYTTATVTVKGDPETSIEGVVGTITITIESDY